MASGLKPYMALETSQAVKTRPPPILDFYGAQEDATGRCEHYLRILILAGKRVTPVFLGVYYSALKDQYLRKEPLNNEFISVK